MKAIERADVALLMIDAEAGITAQDAHIAGYIQDAWLSAVILVNKWDIAKKAGQDMEYFTQNVRQALNFISYAPLPFISAKSGHGVEQVLPTAARVAEERLAQISTS